MAKTSLSLADPDTENDFAIVRRVLAGEQTAFACLMRLFNRQLYRLARSVMGDDAEAEDAPRDAYLSAYRSLSNFSGEPSLGTGFSRFVINKRLGDCDAGTADRA